MCGGLTAEISTMVTTNQFTTSILTNQLTMERTTVLPNRFEPHLCAQNQLEVEQPPEPIEEQVVLNFINDNQVNMAGAPADASIAALSDTTISIIAVVITLIAGLGCVHAAYLHRKHRQQEDFHQQANKTSDLRSQMLAQQSAWALSFPQLADGGQHLVCWRQQCVCVLAAW
jgi:hypothetical protein